MVKVANMFCSLRVLSTRVCYGAAIAMILGVGGVSASDHLPSDCETARDRAKSKYGAVRYHFDQFNQCMMQAGEELKQCQAALNDQQAALGDFIFAQRVAQDVCGREGQSGDIVQPAQSAPE